MSKVQQLNPRYDLFSKELIADKSKEFYLNSLYNTRTNLIKHFKGLGSKEVESITKEILATRIKLKKIEYAPCTFECKSIPIPTPTPALVNSLGGDYGKICEELGLKTKYRYDEFKSDNFKRIKIINCDTREKSPWQFDKNIKVELKTLNVGDYSNPLNPSIVIERKSMNDLLGTFSAGFERFCREILRAKEQNINVVIICESKFNDFLSFNYLPQYKWVKKATPDFISSRIRNLLQLFPNAQIVFVDGRAEAAKLATLVLKQPEIFDWDIFNLYLNKITYN